MRPNPSSPKSATKPAKKPAEAVKDIRRATRRHFSAEDKIRIVLEGLRGEESIAELCRREGIAQSVYYSWSKEFLEAGKRRLAGDTPAQPPVTRSRTCAGNAGPQGMCGRPDAREPPS
jgi:transposase